MCIPLNNMNTHEMERKDEKDKYFCSGCLETKVGEQWYCPTCLDTSKDKTTFYFCSDCVSYQGNHLLMLSI